MLHWFRGNIVSPFPVRHPHHVEAPGTRRNCISQAPKTPRRTGRGVSPPSDPKHHVEAPRTRRDCVSQAPKDNAIKQIRRKEEASHGPSKPPHRTSVDSQGFRKEGTTPVPWTLPLPQRGKKWLRAQEAG